MSCIVSRSEYTYRKSPMRRVVETLQEKKKSRVGLDCGHWTDLREWLRAKSAAVKTRPV